MNLDLAHPSTLLVPAGVAALVGWRLYARVRRMVGRQRLSRVRPWLTVCVFPLLVAMVAVGALANPTAGLGLAAGLAIGVALGVYGLRLTQFEKTPLGLYYTPNAHLGIALSALFIGRLAYRAVQAYSGGAAFQQGTIDFGRSPLTLIIFATLAGYYITYAIGLLRWRLRESERA